MVSITGTSHHHRLDPEHYSISMVTIHNIDVVTDGKTILSQAVERDDRVTVKVLLDMGANPNAPSAIVDADTCAARWESPLVTASRLGLYDVTMALLNAGAMPDSYDSSAHKTPLYWACSKRHGDVASLLITRGANVNCKDIHSESPLVDAIIQGDIHTLGLFIRYGLELNGLITFDRDTPLVFAALVHQEAIGLLLLRAGADPNKLNRCSEDVLQATMEHIINASDGALDDVSSAMVHTLVAAGVHLRPTHERLLPLVAALHPQVAALLRSCQFHPARLHNLAIRTVRRWLLALSKQRGILGLADNLPLPAQLKNHVTFQTVCL